MDFLVTRRLFTIAVVVSLPQMTELVVVIPILIVLILLTVINLAQLHELVHWTYQVCAVVPMLAGAAVVVVVMAVGVA
jgi:hypothetical protein